MLKNTHISRLSSALAALLAAAVLMASGAEEANAWRWSIDSFPKVNRTYRTAVRAWRGYLGHCVQSGIGLYAYDSSELPEDADDYAFTPDLGACQIYFNVDQRENYKRTWFCSVMVHEMGHVAGFDHSPDPHDIMHATNEVYWRKCLTRRQARRYRRRHEIIDYSIADWSGTSASASARRRSRPNPGLTRALRDGRLRVHRLATLPVR